MSKATQSISVPAVVAEPVEVTTHVEYPEDSGHSSGDKGTFVLGVRNDTHIALSGTDLDYTPIAVDADGAVQISDGGNSITVDGLLAVVGTVVAAEPGVSGTPDAGSLWSVYNDPGTNAQATVTKAAPGAGKSLVITGVTFSLAAGTVAPLASIVVGRIIGSTSGQVYAVRMAIPNTAGAATIIASPLGIQGANNESFTVSFNAAAGNNTFESVHMNGYVVTL